MRRAREGIEKLQSASGKVLAREGPQRRRGRDERGRRRCRRRQKAPDARLLREGARGGAPPHREPTVVFGNSPTTRSTRRARRASRVGAKWKPSNDAPSGSIRRRSRGASPPRAPRRRLSPPRSRRRRRAVFGLMLPWGLAIETNHLEDTISPRSSAAGGSAATPSGAATPAAPAPRPPRPPPVTPTVNTPCPTRRRGSRDGARWPVYATAGLGEPQASCRGRFEEGVVLQHRPDEPFRSLSSTRRQRGKATAANRRLAVRLHRRAKTNRMSRRTGVSRGSSSWCDRRRWRARGSGFQNGFQNGSDRDRGRR